ncbi:MAG: tetraacyldisaccharide 4'-kinase [Leptonema illini]|uniref:Tetraacyldisaccharide 4'-kinase n=1 Tax=Leptonema illini TaxID=183 RepID=A0A833H1F5_9LEPT|nr:MAG: tetraacyldisaccharide 4'-kinase [Leptonema illini]
MCRLLARLYLAVHKRTFARRLQNSRSFPGHRIISVGNLSAGGTGKTPVTIELALALLSQRKSVLICLRGYKGRSRSGLLVGDERGVHLTAEHAGDEAVLIAVRLLEYARLHEGARFAVAAGPDRADLIDRFGAQRDVVILDDAFQNPSVRRDLDIVLIDATVPYSRMKLLPCGRFREDLTALERADVVLLTRTNLAPDSALIWKRLIKDRYPNLPIFNIGIRTHRMSAPLAADGRAQSVAAFCGIGNPDSFFRVLEEAGIDVAKRFVFKDHHRFSERDVVVLKGCGMPLVTTEKDAARLGERLASLGTVLVVRPEIYDADRNDETGLWPRLTSLTERQAQE